MILDPKSVASLCIVPFAFSVPLGTATGFVVRVHGIDLLVTNFHVLSGKHPDSGLQLPNTPAVPDRVLIPLLRNRSDRLQWRPVVAPVLGDSGPLWVEHPKLGRAFDVVALPIAVPDDTLIVPYELDPGAPLALHMASEVAVIGFPEGMTATGLTAIWKAGTIASEHDFTLSERGFFWIDSNTRRGMSGAPVIARRFGTALMENGDVALYNSVSDRVLGVYAGRAFDAPDMTLGRVWGWPGVQEILVYAAEQVLLGRRTATITQIGYLQPENLHMPTIDITRSVSVPIMLPNGTREQRDITVGQLIRDLALCDPRFADSLESVKMAAKIEAAIQAAEDTDGELSLDAVEFGRIAEYVEKPQQGFNPHIARFLLPLLEYIVGAGKEQAPH